MFHITKRAMVKKDYKELDETIKAKCAPFLYNNGDGKMVPIAQLACLRNRDRSVRKQVSFELLLITKPQKELTDLSALVPGHQRIGRSSLQLCLRGK